MDQTTLPYDRLIENHIEHLKREYRRQRSDVATLPQFWFLTTTFVAVESKRDDHLSPPASSLYRPLRAILCPAPPQAHEQFRSKAVATAPNLCLHRLSVHQAREAIRHACHRSSNSVPTNSISIPSIQKRHLISIQSCSLHQQLVDRFRAIKPELESFFGGLDPANLHAAWCPVANL